MSRTTSLFIPVRLRASLVGQIPEKNIYSDLSYDFTWLGSPDAATEKPLFSERRDRSPGVYLHWSLPDYLTHGVHDEASGEILYRLVPNRWAVLRIWKPHGATADIPLRGRAFLVESDTVSRQNTGGPSWPWPQDTKMPYRFLGRSCPMEEEPQGDTEHIRLTAVSPVSPFFAAYAPFCENVFGFHDDLAGEKLSDIDLSYLVCGWYQEHGEPEPFRDAHNWEELAEQFGLSGSGDCFPSQTLCHGMIDSIHWKNEHVVYHSGTPDDPMPGQTVNAPLIAMGNSSSEALSALLTERHTDPAQYFMNLMLCGLDQDLGRRQGIAGADAGLHKARFTVHPSPGVTGVRRQPEKDDSETTPLTGAFTERLAALRSQQRKLSHMHARLVQKQRSAYESWFLSLYADPPYDREYSLQTDRSIESAALLLHKLSAQIDDIRRKQQDLKKDLSEMEQNREYTLTEEMDAPFYLPAEPVLVLSQDCASDDTKPASPLVCRISGQNVTALHICEICGISTVLDGASLMPEFVFARQVPEMIRDEILALAAETVLMSSGFADWLAGCAFQKAGKIPTADQLALLSAQLRQAQGCASASSPFFMGTLPPSPARTRYQPQWQPLILEWQCCYYPDLNVMNRRPDFSRWTLADGEYHYNCTDTPDPVITRDNEYIVEGRLYISDHAQGQLEALSSRLFAADDFLLPPLTETIQKTLRLSQALDGFSSSLLMRKAALPPALFLSHPARQDQLDIIKAFDSTALKDVPVFDALFAPMRAGFLSLSRLRIIDALGRFSDIFSPDVYASDSMKLPSAANPVRYLMLPPRILSPARLSAFFLAAGKSEPQEAFPPNACPPVCGFLMPNLLDYSLMVFKGDGMSAGSLNLVGVGSGIRWKSPPGSPDSAVLPDDLDPELYALLRELLLAGGHTLRQLLEYINNLQDYSQSANHAPSRIEFFGRPIAVARILARLELLGDAEYYRHYAGSETTDQTGETDLCCAQFPMLVGSLVNPADGIIGFFADGDYTRFHIHPDVDMQNAEEPDAYFCACPQTLLTPDPDAAPKLLTLLFDPWSDITLTTGILPVSTLSLEKDYVEEALRRMDVTYFCAPVLAAHPFSIPTAHADALEFFWESQDENKNWNLLPLPYEDARLSDMEEPVFIAEGYVRIRAKEQEDTDDDKH